MHSASEQKYGESEDKSMINNPEINQAVWFIDKWSQLPASGTIAKIFEHEDTACATVHLGIGGTANYRLSDLYASLEAVETAMQQKEAAEISRIKSEIHTVSDLVSFMYNNCVAYAEEYTDWTARKAVKEIAEEMLGLELEE